MASRYCGLRSGGGLDPVALRSEGCRRALRAFWGDGEPTVGQAVGGGIGTVVDAVAALDTSSLRSSVTGALDFGVRILEDTKKKLGASDGGRP